MTSRLCVVVSVALALILPTAAFAQSVPKVQGAGGFAYLTSPNAVLVTAISNEKPGQTGGGGGPAKGPGWFGELIANFNPYVGFVAQLSSTRTSGTFNSRAWVGKDMAYALVGGPRFSVRHSPDVVPFAQALFGFVRSTAAITENSTPAAAFTDTYWAFAAGGGADIRVGGSVGVHLGADVLRTTRGDGLHNSALTARVQAGVIFPMR